MKIATLVPALTLVTAFSSVGSAGVLYQETFNDLPTGGPDIGGGNPLADDGWFNANGIDAQLGGVDDVTTLDGNYMEGPRGSGYSGNAVDDWQQKQFTTPTELSATTQNVYYSFNVLPNSFINDGLLLRPSVSPASSGSVNNVGPAFGLVEEGTDIRLKVRESPFGAEYVVDPATPIATSDWIELRLVLNQDTNDITASTASLYYRNITQGETELAPVPGIQDVAIGLSSAVNAGTIDTWILENFKTQERVDNLTVGIVPEPGSVALMGLGAVALLRRRR